MSVTFTYSTDFVTVVTLDVYKRQDTDLYRLYNTNIHEKIAEQKKKEAKFAD